jgi:hypothetical protein
MYMKTGNLTVLSDDIYENKPFNTPSALAQRQCSAVSRLFATTRVYVAKRRLEAASARAPLRCATSGSQTAPLRCKLLPSRYCSTRE